MKEKIKHLMKSEGLTTTRLAEILEIQPSAVSHLVSGRNKPSYDNLQKILRRFPRVNPDWLLLDSEEPYRSEVDMDESESLSPDATLDQAEHDNMPFGFAGAAGGVTPSAEREESTQPLFNILPPTSRGTKSPIFVVLFYDDGSCESFSMRSK